MARHLPDLAARNGISRREFESRSILAGSDGTDGSISCILNNIFELALSKLGDAG